MGRTMKRKLSRRHLLAGLAAGAGAMSAPAIIKPRQAHSAPNDGPPPKFVIVVTGFGGASIIDSFMPISETEAGTAAPTVNSYPDVQVAQNPGWGNGTMKALNSAGNLLGNNFVSILEDFVDAYIDDMLVCTMTGTSVNHTIAQKRAITGNGAWSGRTIQEAVAVAYGEGCPLPNVNMASHGYAGPGADVSVPDWARAEPVGVPKTWPFSLHGTRGVKIEDGGPQDGPDATFIEMARELRNAKLDPESSFYTTFQLSHELQRYKNQRNVVQPKIEEADLISKLMLSKEGELPLDAYGLSSSPELAAVEAMFPYLGFDPLHAQAALAYLLITQGVSVAVTIGTNFNIALGDGSPGVPLVLNPPLSFDNSHTQHRLTQAFMWKRMTDTISGLITLLKGAQFGDGGESYWDRSMIYLATDFGRSKLRLNNPGGEFGSGHNLNNGVLAISPMLNGGRVLGGVDPRTGETYGFDPNDGSPTAAGQNMSEPQIYGGLVNALGIDTGGAVPDMPIMRG
jgi:hypothetical protein